MPVRKEFGEHEPIVGVIAYKDTFIIATHRGLYVYDPERPEEIEKMKLFLRDEEE